MHFQDIKLLNTLRFNFYPNQSKPIEISKQDPGLLLDVKLMLIADIYSSLSG
ncbi:MAG: hypothetical protein CM1200mP5_0040 [Candidatus Pelagibacterales bacterium]|nr:MAG: hypothetical protein CM1200mP5_0040 [Pelagibacterales bacterium]